MNAFFDFELFYSANKLILEMSADGPPLGYDILKYVIISYLKKGEVGLAMVKLLESRGFKPDLCIYDALVSICSEDFPLTVEIVKEANSIYKFTPEMYQKMHAICGNLIIMVQFLKFFAPKEEVQDKCPKAKT